MVRTTRVPKEPPVLVKAFGITWIMTIDHWPILCGRNLENDVPGSWVWGEPEVEDGRSKLLCWSTGLPKRSIGQRGILHRQLEAHVGPQAQKTTGCREAQTISVGDFVLNWDWHTELDRRVFLVRLY